MIYGKKRQRRFLLLEISKTVSEIATVHDNNKLKHPGLFHITTTHCFQPGRKKAFIIVFVTWRTTRQQAIFVLKNN